MRCVLLILLAGMLAGGCESMDLSGLHHFADSLPAHPAGPSARPATQENSTGMHLAWIAPENAESAAPDEDLH